MVAAPGVSHRSLSHFPDQSQDESRAFGFQGPLLTTFETPITVSEIYSLALESSVTKSQTLIGQKDPIYLPSGPDDLSRPESDHSNEFNQRTATNVQSDQMRSVAGI